MLCALCKLFDQRQKGLWKRAELCEAQVNKHSNIGSGNEKTIEPSFLSDEV